MQLELYYFGSFETEFKDNKYIIYNFVDENSLQIINGSNCEIKTEKPLVKYEKYNCHIDIKGNKLKVLKVTDTK